MATQKYCQVVVSWPVDDGRSVEDVVIYNIESDFDEGQMPSSTLDSLTDLFLSPPVTESGDPGPPCRACISVRESTPGFAVAAVDVLSSARNVEVFSSTGEYLVLAEGTRLDVAGERKLFLSQHTFDQPQPTCDLKFVSLVDPQTLWLHSLHLTLAVDKTSPAFPLAMGPSIDMDKVNAIISDMDADVPDRAKGLMSTMTSLQKNKERAMGNIFGSGGKGPPTMASIMGMFANMGVTSQTPPTALPPAAPAQPQPKPQQQPPQGKAEATQNSGSKNKKNKKSGKKGQKNGGGGSGVPGNTEAEVEKIAAAPKQEQPKQSQPKSRPNSGEQSSQPKGKKQKDNSKKDSEDSPRNDGSNKKKSGSNANNKNSTGNSNNTNSGSESSKKNSGSDSARSKKEQKGASKEAKPQQQVAKDTKRSDSVDAQSPVTQADLAALEQRLLERIDKAEEAVVLEVASQIEASEQRLKQHVEGLVSKMASAFFGGGNMMNGSGRMEDLTPD